MRAADYDDWITETRSKDGKPMHGLNGDILVWNPVTKRRHELTSMGIRVNAETLKKQLEMSGQQDFLKSRQVGTSFICRMLGDISYSNKI